MSKIRIIGGKPISGKVIISASKNASLPIITSSLLTTENITLPNPPLLRDITTLTTLLKHLGAEVKQDNNNLLINSANINNTLAPFDIVNKMRASFLVLGPLLARFGKAKVGLPGGCSIGNRLINYHLEAFVKMGASIHIENNYVYAHTEQKLKGCEIQLEIPSVGATENILMAATLAEGTTTINNAAIEPEVSDLVNCLLKMGAQIDGIGTHTLTIQGVKSLNGCNHNIIPDRIEAATYAIAAAVTEGSLTLNNVNHTHLSTFISLLTKIGVQIHLITENTIQVTAKKAHIKARNFTTDFYPGIATDLQPLLVVLLSIADGESIVTETIFNNRFANTHWLNKMGGNIITKGNIAYISGVKHLTGKNVIARDLRAGASLVLAGLCAKGETVISDTHHIERGYDRLEQKLSLCNANIERINS